MSEQIILVDENDQEVGIGEKMEVHRKALLHRAFSILVFNDNYELLIQQRAKSKYHCPGIWANTCCSHPRAGEKLEDAIHRRLPEEMGFDCELQEKFSFIYKAEFDNGLTEYEYDHVFIGYYNGEIIPNKEEVDHYKWISMEDLKKDIKKEPNKYAPWFKIIIDKYNT